MCRAELRLLKDQYPAFADRINFVGVGMDPSESAADLERYRQAQGYPWPVAVGNRAMFESYRIIGPSIKYAMDHQGVIQYQQGYGVRPAEEWNRVLRSLVGA